MDSHSSEVLCPTGKLRWSDGHLKLLIRLLTVYSETLNPYLHKRGRGWLSCNRKTPCRLLGHRTNSNQPILATLMPTAVCGDPNCRNPQCVEWPHYPLRIFHSVGIHKFSFAEIGSHCPKVASSRCSSPLAWPS